MKKKNHFLPYIIVCRMQYTYLVQNMKNLLNNPWIKLLEKKQKSMSQIMFLKIN